MKKINLMICLFSMLFGFSALADDDHTANYCSATNENVCAHLGHFSGVNSSSEAQFMFHATTPNDEQMTDLTIDLWMPEMGHGSAPVSFEAKAVNLYKVTNAFFIMPGEWLVRTRFKLGDTEHAIDIPVTIKE